MAMARARDQSRGPVMPCPVCLCHASASVVCALLLLLVCAAACACSAQLHSSADSALQHCKLTRVLRVLRVEQKRVVDGSASAGHPEVSALRPGWQAHHRAPISSLALFLSSTDAVLSA
eukprot:389983-Rhodomonas_salina.2